MWCDLSFLKKFGWRKSYAEDYLHVPLSEEKIKFSVWLQKKNSLQLLHSRI